MKKFDLGISAEGKKEFAAHWAVLLTAMVGLSLSSLHLYSLGVMIAPLEREFAWSRTDISFGLMIVSMVVFPLAPFMGRAIDRFGSRRMALCGAAFYFGSLACLSFAQAPVWTWWMLWVLVAFGHLFLTPTIWIAAISRLFDASRGLALAITMSGGGVASFAGPILTSILVEHFGWRMAYVCLGALAATIVLPIVYLFFIIPSDAPSGPARAGSVAAAMPPRTGLTVREALGSIAFIRLATASFILSVMTMSLLVNLVPILSSLGLDKTSAPEIAGLVGITQIIGRLGGGMLLDRFNARVVGAVTVLFPIIACALLLVSDGSAIMATTAILAFGLTVGAETDVIAYLTARFVGVRNFGTLFGGILALLTLGAGLGPVLASFIFDLTKSYEIVLWVALFLSLIASLLLLSLGSYPHFESEAPTQPIDADPGLATAGSRPVAAKPQSA
jgi:MFS family permease